MDSRLQRLGGGRLAHLRYLDAPKVAQAIVDAEYGQARVSTGISHDIPYVKFIRGNIYTVVVRGDDWRRIFPFLRYGSEHFTPVIPPAIQPPPIPSFQPNRVVQPPPENPSNGLTTFLTGFPYDEYSKIQTLLGTGTVNSLDAPSGAWKPLNSERNGVDMVVSSNATFASFKQEELFKRLLDVLQKLFPTDFPTTSL